MSTSCRTAPLGLDPKLAIYRTFNEACIRYWNDGPASSVLVGTWYYDILVYEHLFVLQEETLLYEMRCVCLRKSYSE